MKIYIDGEKLMESFYDTPESEKSWSRAWRLINHAKLADVRENVRGKWWHEPHTNNTWVQRCSNCFQIAMITIEEECPYNYCPICGADMRGGTA